jgi:SAM-dependent methyltransferase
METMARAKKTRISAVTSQQQSDTDAANTPGNEAPIGPEQILTFLAENPDLDLLRAKYPQLDAKTLRGIFARAAELTGDAPTIRRRKCANQTEMLKTHGLPEPDGTLHKGNVFRSLLGPLKPGKMLDLGAGRGNFSLSAAQMGWQVTAVDARNVRWPDADAELDSEVAELIRSITWIQADVREFPIGRGEYDLICVLGLLHHLEIPDQLNLVRRCTGTPLLIDTRIAPAVIDREGAYEGMIVREHGEDREERDQVPTASWGNPNSFRHTEESLLRLIRDCGYPQVMMMRPPHRRDYTFYLGLPRNAEAKRGKSGRKPKTVMGRDRGGEIWSHWSPEQPENEE